MIADMHEWNLELQCFLHGHTIAEIHDVLLSRLTIAKMHGFSFSEWAPWWALVGPLVALVGPLV